MFKKVRDFIKSKISHNCLQKVSSSVVLFTWTPLISASDFTGIQTDVGTVVSGLITIFLVLAGFAVLVRVFTR
jgi:hypothetical protein